MSFDYPTRVIFEQGRGGYMQHAGIRQGLSTPPTIAGQRVSEIDWVPGLVCKVRRSASERMADLTLFEILDLHEQVRAMVARQAKEHAPC